MLAGAVRPYEEELAMSGYRFGIDEDEADDGPCPDCDGDGFIEAECFEDSCCCARPDMEHGYRPCPTCVERPRR